MENTSVDIFDSVGSEEINNITRDLIEVGLDTLFEDGILKDIPIIGTAFNLYNAGKKVRAAHGQAVTLKFLLELKDVPIEKRIKFIEKLDSEKKRLEVSRNVLLLLSRIDEIDKSTIIGKLFKAYIEEEIDRYMFFRISYMVEKVFFSDLINLRYYSSPTKPRLTEQQRINLYRVGLFDQVIDTQVRIYHGGTSIKEPKYSMNKYGITLAKICFD